MKSLDPSLEIIPITQFTTSLPFSQKVTSCLTYIFEIGAKIKEFSMVIILNHKTLKEVYCLHLIDHQALMVEGIHILNAMNETNASEKTTICSSWGL